MILQTIGFGLWLTGVTIASSYAAAYFLTDLHETAEIDVVPGLDYERTNPISVPMIENGSVQGYVVAKFVFTMDGDALRSLSVPPHSFVMDAAFRTIYADEALDFRNLERYDLDALTDRIRDSVNERLGKPLVRDLLIEELAFHDKAEVLLQ